MTCTRIFLRMRLVNKQYISPTIAGYSQFFCTTKNEDFKSISYYLMFFVTLLESIVTSPPLHINLKRVNARNALFVWQT